MNPIQWPDPTNLPKFDPSKKSKKPIDDAVSKQRENMPPSQKADDTLKSRKLTRRNSVHELGRGDYTTDESKEIAQHSGVLWECVARKPNKAGGYLYIFKIRPEFRDNYDTKNDNAQKKKDAIFPAVEMTGIETLPFNSRLSIEEKVKLKMHHTHGDGVEVLSKASWFKTEAYNYEMELKRDADFNSKLNQLGYDSYTNEESQFLVLPDKEALEANWELLRETKQIPTDESTDPKKEVDMTSTDNYSRLSKLEIVPSEGIASDMAFVEAYMAHDGLLSSGKEFVHDHYGHLIPLLKFKYKSETQYTMQRNELRAVIEKTYRKIEMIRKEINEGKTEVGGVKLKSITRKLEQIEGLLGALVDSISSRYEYVDYGPEKVNQQYVEGVYSEALRYGNKTWRPYFEGRLGERFVEPFFLELSMRNIDAIVQYLDTERAKNADQSPPSGPPPKESAQ